MPARSDFYDGVVSEFAFLERDFGFRGVAPSSESTLESFCFTRTPLTVEVGWYKGEVDVCIRVATDTAILRPYRRKAFYASEIALHQKPDVFRVRPDLPEFAISVSDALAFVRFNAGLLREHCGGILRGDLTVLEEIIQKETK